MKVDIYLVNSNNSIQIDFSYEGKVANTALTLSKGLDYHLKLIDSRIREGTYTPFEVYDAKVSVHEYYSDYRTALLILVETTEFTSEKDLYTHVFNTYSESNLKQLYPELFI